MKNQQVSLLSIAKQNFLTDTYLARLTEWEIVHNAVTEPDSEVEFIDSKPT
jgi:hypothetical protein